MSKKIEGEMTLLTSEQASNKYKINVIRNYGNECILTDFAILLGATVNDGLTFRNQVGLDKRIGTWFLSDNDAFNDVYCIASSFAGCNHSRLGNMGADSRYVGIRPVLKFEKKEIRQIQNDSTLGEDHINEIAYGEYPQNAVSKDLDVFLEVLFKMGKLAKTGKTYTTDSRKYNDFSMKFEKM